MKKHAIFSLIFSIILALNFIPSGVCAYSFPINDEINDVAHFIDNKFQDQGDFCDEVDIVKLEKVSSNLELTLQNAPIIDKLHMYTCTIHWDGNETYFTNYSTATIGSLYYHYVNNSVMTYLEDSSGQLVVQHLVNGIITLDERKIIMPLINHSLIENPENPSWIRAYAAYTFEDVFHNFNYYVDYLPDYEWWITEPSTYQSPTESVSGLKMIVSVISISVMVVIVYKKKSSFCVFKKVN
ncbi:MAG: hypothetical protein FK730_09985 [Asgard group archaeon]|nr:hypothetical protein [Asgard group archaeon]